MCSFCKKHQKTTCYANFTAPKCNRTTPRMKRYLENDLSVYQNSCQCCCSSSCGCGSCGTHCNPCDCCVKPDPCDHHHWDPCKDKILEKDYGSCCPLS